MSGAQTFRDITIADGSVVRLSLDKLLVFEAMEACFRRRPDATMHEVLEVLNAQLGYVVQANSYSGRFSDLVKLGVIEVCPEKRDDVSTLRRREKHGRASPVNAWRLPVMQRRLIA